MAYPCERAAQATVKRKSPDVGDPAPDATLTDTEGNKVQLSSIWEQKPVVLIFLRHFGCPFCRAQVAQLRSDYARFIKANAEVVCVAMGPYQAGKAFSILFDLPFPVLVCGDDSSIYGRYGLEKGTFANLFNWNVMVKSFSALRNGFAAPVGDPKQLPGAFIVDTHGTVLFARRATDQADNVSTDLLLSVLETSRKSTEGESN